MRSLADQTEQELGGRWSVLSRQKRDHVRLDRLLEELGHAEGAHQEDVLHRIARLVFPHAFAEESVLWPELRRRLPDGEKLTLQVEQEHQEVNELWSALERTSHDDPERRALLDRLTDVLRQDVRDEEDLLLPRLQDSLDGPRLRRLGVAWEAVRRAAPTRPHPVVSRRPPGNVLAAAPLTMVDRSRDLLDLAGRRSAGRSQRWLGSASRRLGDVAGRVERWDPLRRGERPSTRRED